MSKIFSVTFLFIISACTDVNSFKKLNSETPINLTEYNKALAREYRYLSQDLSDKWQFSEAKYFARKSSKALRGEAVPAEEFAKWNVPQSEIANLEWANARLENIMIDTVQHDYPSRLAHIQMLKDCWILKAGSAKKSDVEECRVEFVLEMSILENILIPTPTPEPNVIIPATISKNEEVVEFALGSDFISSDGIQLLKEVIKDLEGKSNYILKIQGYKDSSEVKNKKLPEKRVKKIAGYLINHGVDKDSIKEIIDENISSPTDEDVKNNRRVVINIEDKN